MGVPMDPKLVLIVCRVILGPSDDNGAFTGWRPSEWDMAEGVMHCRREVIELYDPSVDMGATPRPFNNFACMSAAARLGPQFDIDHKDKPWRFWRAACPTPIVREDGTIVGWKIPECPESYGTVICEKDSVI